MSEYGGQMVITRDHDSDECLQIYPLPNWERVEQSINALPNMNPAARRLQRRMIGSAHECEMSAQGRLSVPAHLREKAGMDKQVVLIGQGNKFELWDAQRWEAYDNDQDSKAGMAELGADVLSTLSL